MRLTNNGLKLMETGAQLNRLNQLDTRITLELSLDELRMIIGCFKAVKYQMEVDNEPYLDADGLSLKSWLEEKYENILEETRDIAQ